MVRRELLPVFMTLWAFALVPLEAKAQSTAWTARYNSGFVNAGACPGACDSARGQRSIALDAAGNIYVTGLSYNGSGNDYRTIKYAASDGSMLWSVGYNGPANSSDYAYAIALDGTGNAYVTGLSYNGSGNADYRTIKYAASDGSVLWSVGYDGAAGSTDVAYALAVDGTGNAYVTGYSSNGGNTDYRTIKYAASDGSVLWSVGYNGSASSLDTAYAIAVDGMGNAYVTGYSSNGGNTDYRTIKYAASDGSVLWSVDYNGPANSADQAYAIAVDATGNAYVTGYSNNGSNADYRTIKYAASDGSVLWSVGYNGPANSSDSAYALALDGTGNAYVTGISYNGGADYRTIKYATSDGSVLWSVGYNGPANNSDYAYALALDDTGNAYVTGYSSNGSNYDYRTIKYAASDGSVLWNVGDGGAANDDQAYAIAVDGNGNACVTGTSYNGSDNDYRTIKYAAADGSASYSVAEGLTAGADDRPGAGGGVLGKRSIAIDGAGNTYVTGRSSNGSNNDYRTVKHAPNGNVLWSVGYNGPANGEDQAYAIAVDGTGNAYVTGYSWSGSNADYRTIKYAASDGSVLWSVGYDGPANSADQAYAIVVDATGNAYVTGYSNGAPSGNADYRTIKYAASDGSVLWSVGYNGPANSADEAYAIAVDATGNAYVTGYSNGSASVNADYRTIKYAASDGSVLWSVAYNGPANSLDTAYAIALDGTGNAYVTGRSYNGSGNADYRTIKYAASDGSALWSVAYNGPANSHDQAYAIAVDGTGNAYVTGDSSNASGNGDYRTLKYAVSNGSVLWSASYNVSLRHRCVTRSA